MRRRAGRRSSRCGAGPRASAASSAAGEAFKAACVARIAAVVADVMLASRVQTSLQAAGHEVELDSTVPDELDGGDLVAADLESVAPERLGERGAPVTAL